MAYQEQPILDATKQNTLNAERPKTSVAASVSRYGNKVSQDITVSQAAIAPMIRPNVQQHV